MTKRVEAQVRVLRDLREKLGMKSHPGIDGSTLKDETEVREVEKVIDEDSEFELGEGETLDDENVLDLKIVNGVFNEHVVDTVQSSFNGGRKVTNDFETFVLIDFFDHGSKNTDIAFGLRP